MNTLAFLAGSITTAAAGTVGALLLPQRPPQGHWWNGMTRCYYREGEE